MNYALLYEVALTLVSGIGDVNGKKLVAYCGGAEAVFREKKKSLSKIPGIGEKTVDGILSQDVLSRAERELDFADKYGIRILYYLNSDYPKRLQHCYDSPMILYCNGNTNLNVDKVIGVIQGVTSVIEGANAVISVLSTTSMSANTAALIANTAALYANAATNFLPFANGGIIKAFSGTLVGNTYSGDQLRGIDNQGQLYINKSFKR